MGYNGFDNPLAKNKDSNNEDFLQLFFPKKKINMLETLYRSILDTSESLYFDFVKHCFCNFSIINSHTKLKNYLVKVVFLYSFRAIKIIFPQYIQYQKATF